jgi:uncharacterized protein
MTLFIDTAVIMYAGGAEHSLQQPSRRILSRVADGTLEAVTSVEVIQEILHRFTALRRQDLGTAMARDALDLFAPVLPVTHAVMRRMPELVERHPALSARDLVHVATCQQEGITEIVSPDRGFDIIPGIRRLDLATAALG